MSLALIAFVDEVDFHDSHDVEELVCGMVHPVLSLVGHLEKSLNLEKEVGEN